MKCIHSVDVWSCFSLMGYPRWVIWKAELVGFCGLSELWASVLVASYNGFSYDLQFAILTEEYRA